MRCRHAYVKAHSNIDFKYYQEGPDELWAENEHAVLNLSVEYVISGEKSRSYFIILSLILSDVTSGTRNYSRHDNYYIWVWNQVMSI